MNPGGGAPLRIRPVRPEDAPAYAEFMGRIAPEDLRMRFERGVPARDLARYTEIDPERESAFVAVTPGAPDDILGEVRVYRFPDGETAEFAILVRSDAQRRGIGRALLREAIDYSRARRKGADRPDAPRQRGDDRPRARSRHGRRASAGRELRRRASRAGQVKRPPWRSRSSPRSSR